MTKPLLLALCVLLTGAGSILAYLLATGERGIGSLGSSYQWPARTLTISRLPAAQSQALGWKPEGLDAVFGYAATLSTDSLLIVTGGQIVGSFGDLSAQYDVHSIRKVFLSALIGQFASDEPKQERQVQPDQAACPEHGRIPLHASLRALKINDAPTPLSDLQQTAQVEQLLESRSGINHPAAAEAGLTAQKERRLGKEAQRPGTVWAYNNWDYNALTTIFEKCTGLTIAQAFLQGIAKPAGMQDFSLANVAYISEPHRSEHRAAAFKMSARDLATFGQIYLNKGKRNGHQIVPAAWIARIGRIYSKTGRTDLRWGHSDLWWLPGPKEGLPPGTYWGWGLGNQALFVIPAWDTVIVVQSDTTAFLKKFLPRISGGTGQQTGETSLEALIRACRAPDQRQSSYCIEDRFTTRRELEQLIATLRAARLQGTDQQAKLD